MTRKEGRRLVEAGKAVWIEGGNAIVYRRTGVIIRFLDEEP